MSPNGRLLASAAYDCSVCIWNLRDGSRKYQWYGSSSFSSVSFHPDGRYLASGDHNADFWVWDVRTGQLAARFNIGRKTYLRVTIAPDGRRVAIGREEQLWCLDFGLLKDTHSVSDGDTDGDDISCQLDPIFEFNDQVRSLTLVNV